MLNCVLPKRWPDGVKNVGSVLTLYELVYLTESMDIVQREINYVTIATPIMSKTSSTRDRTQAKKPARKLEVALIVVIEVHRGCVKTQYILTLFLKDCPTKVSFCSIICFLIVFIIFVFISITVHFALHTITCLFYFYHINHPFQILLLINYQR
jgi:hypothetical protein